MILTTSTHYSQVEPFIKSDTMIAMVAMTPSVSTVVKLAKIEDDRKVGIFCASDAFAGVVRNNCQGMGVWSEHMATQFMGIFEETEQFFEENDVIIVPKGYETFLSPEEKVLIEDFVMRGGELVRYSYKVDKGSFLYVVEQIKKVMNKKRNV